LKIQMPGHLDNQNWNCLTSSQSDVRSRTLDNNLWDGRTFIQPQLDGQMNTDYKIWNDDTQRVKIEVIRQSDIATLDIQILGHLDNHNLYDFAFWHSDVRTKCIFFFDNYELSQFVNHLLPIQYLMSIQNTSLRCYFTNLFYNKNIRQN
jgi:hypothetical protein